MMLVLFNLAIICLCPMIASAGKASEIYLRQIKARLDVIEPSLAVWSGFTERLSQCGITCLHVGRCVSLLYSPVNNSCQLFDVIYGETGGTGDTGYYILDTGSTISVPESCVDIATCSGITTDGEYWIYPKSLQKQRIRIFCHKMEADPTEYVTLKNNNSFIQHDPSNWPNGLLQCYSNYTLPLKQADFTKVQIQIQNMEVNGTDYTFALMTGPATVPFGHSQDCNGEKFMEPCEHFGSATIDTRGTGLRIDLTLAWGVTLGWASELRDFTRSTDGAEISFTCAGWCGHCGPISGPIRFELSTEFTAEAKAVICKT